MKILAGAEHRDGGEILIDGKPVTIDSPQKAMELGISIIYQEFNLVPYLSAGENIYLGREPRAALPGFVDFKTLYREAQKVLDALGVRIDARTPVNQLSVAQQQMVEIAKATSKKSRIIVMDEPSATLTDHELVALFGLMRQLKSQGVSIIYISHRLEEVFEVCDRATIMRDGTHIATMDVKDLTRDEIIRLMVGRELKDAIPKVPAKLGPPALAVKHLNRTGVLHDINFEVRQGEVLGIAGLVGAGRTETARVIFGADPLDSGTIEVFGKPVTIRSPQDAIKHGIGLVTEDRKQQGLVLGMAVRENNTLANLGALSDCRFHQAQAEKKHGGRVQAEPVHQDADHRADGAEPVGRQSAEGGSGEVAVHRLQNPDFRRADARH